ncbi:MAG: hypothetical protein SFW36_09350 [Leptolyngbyaceae cyanobacterium bins.59]|nr:hypothetical protein [Leptolyngbyaceae cyanobacterium bins.59]
MTGFDLLILAVYAICVTLVFTKVIESFDDKYTIAEDKGDLGQQLERKELQGMIAIKFGFDKRYKLDDLKKFAVIVDNKTQEQTVYLDWDMCSLTDLGGQSRRVIRIPPQLTADVFQAQISSTIAPGRTLKQDITAEDVLKVKDGGVPSIDSPLISITKLNDKKSSDKDKEKYAKFMSGKASLEFVVRLAFQVTDDRGMLSYPTYVSCKILLKKLPWTDAFPWNQKK